MLKTLQQTQLPFAETKAGCSADIRDICSSSSVLEQWPRSRASLTIGLWVICFAAGCAAPAVRLEMPILSATPNPSTDGAYTVSWTPIRGASKYQLYEDGKVSYVGARRSHSYVDKAEGTYTYALSYCVTALGIEACNFRAAVADVTVTVTHR